MNSFRYFPNSEKDIERLYRILEIKNKNELFGRIMGDIPLMDESLLETLSPCMDEKALYGFFSDIDSNLPDKNKFSIFAGGGIYNHFIPAAIDSLVSRSEFYTPYTPYQPEVSQGTLFALFEFQSMIAEISGMDVVNASMYDGAESLAEAVLMSIRLCKGNNNLILISEGVNPRFVSVIKTFIGDTGIKIENVALDDKTGRTNMEDLKLKLKLNGKNGATVVVQQPNYFGIIEDLEELEPVIHGFNPRPFFIVSSTEPYSFGVISPPGSYDVDIFAGEGNSFGNYMNFGGPLLGLFGAKKEYVRQMPGRIVGKTKDNRNKDAYSFILSTREQHIRRGAATSNICTNSSLNAVRAAIYLSLCSKEGFSEISLLNLKLSHILREKLLKTPLFESLYSGDFFNEFSLRISNSGVNAAIFIEEMAKREILAGIEISESDILISVTENNSLIDIDRYIENAKAVLT